MTHQSRRADGGARGGWTEETGGTRRQFLTSTTAVAVGATGLAAGGGVAGAQSGGSPPVLDLTDGGTAVEGTVPTGADDVVFFVHGWFGTSGVEAQASSFASALAQNDFDRPVVAVRYDATSVNFSTARRSARGAAGRFAEWLAGYEADEPGTSLRVVGHSLGGYMIMELLSAVDGDFVVDSLAPIGAAVQGSEVCPGGAYYDAIEASAGEVHNYHSRNDETICGSFGGDGMGCEGASCSDTPGNYRDVDVTDSVGNHVAYPRPDSGCVDQIVANFGSVYDGTEDDGGPPAVGDSDSPPTDPDGDDLYEDVNGNGDGDLADAVDLFQHRDSPAVTDHVEAYDFSGNDEVDLADVVELFQENTA